MQGLAGSQIATPLIPGRISETPRPVNSTEIVASFRFSKRPFERGLHLGSQLNQHPQ